MCNFCRLVDPNKQTGVGGEGYTMEHHTLKNVNNCLNTTIYSYLETPGACIIKLITAVIYGFHN
jgi:hypothetical protein